MTTDRSKNIPEDTIAAICTGAGGNIAVIRLSGPAASSIAESIWRGTTHVASLEPRTLALGKIIDTTGEVVDNCVIVSMPAPNSYTGENVIEFHCHGGQMVSRTVLASALAHGARHAEPGEFTKRAFLNGKIDLTQAEAVLDVIESQSEMALHTANRQLDGALTRKVNTLHTSLTHVLSEIEVRMDFCDEDLDWEPLTQLRQHLAETLEQVDTLLRSRQDGEVLREGICIAIVGAPNAGKSSLLNAILGRDRAIVTQLPGTTRDTLEEFAHIRGIPVRLIDTAGIRETTDKIEEKGIARSLSSIGLAQLVLWVIDSTRPIEDQELDSALITKKSVIRIANKIDLVDKLPVAPEACEQLVPISALTGDGLDRLYDAVEERVWRYPHAEEPEVAVNARHGALLEEARQHINDALAVIDNQDYELLAVSLRGALDSLGIITGKTATADILDDIFHRFCIGK